MVIDHEVHDIFFFYVKIFFMKSRQQKVYKNLRASTLTSFASLVVCALGRLVKLSQTTDQLLLQSQRLIHFFLLWYCMQQSEGMKEATSHSLFCACEFVASFDNCINCAIIVKVEI